MCKWISQGIGTSAPMPKSAQATSTRDWLTPENTKQEFHQQYISQLFRFFKIFWGRWKITMQIYSSYCFKQFPIPMQTQSPSSNLLDIMTTLCQNIENTNSMLNCYLPNFGNLHSDILASIGSYFEMIWAVKHDEF